ncbi:MAG: Hsp33 family molecular chaperone HslO [Lachnospiraceae bacterium]|nr:Hsp33 family molecular chaperone HslO [Lachnospiraceae bacterium]
MDRIVRATAANAQIRIFAAETKELANEAATRHHTSPVATAALGRLLTAAAMMSTMLKGEDDLLTLRITGDGPIGAVTVTADSSANVKGYVINPEVDLPLNGKGKLDVSGAIGNGRLDVIRDMGLKEPYVGQIPLISGEIAEDLTYYFANSEQVPSSVGLGVLVDTDYSVRRAGGFIVQLLPNADDKVIDMLEENLKKIKSVTALFEEGKTAEDLIEILGEGMDPEITETVPTKFYCNCSKERVTKALISIGKEEIQAMIEEGETVNLNCSFCNTDYPFTVEELKRIAKEAK